MQTSVDELYLRVFFILAISNKLVYNICYGIYFFISQISSRHFRQSHRAGSYRAHAQKSDCSRQRRACVHFHRHERHGQNFRCEDFCKGGQLPFSSCGRFALRKVRKLRGTCVEFQFRYSRNRRRIQQLCRPNKRAYRQNRFSAYRRQVQSLHRRRSSHAFKGGVQRSSQNSRRTAVSCDFHSCDNRDSSNPGNHFVKMLAFRFSSCSKRRDCKTHTFHL